MSLQRSSVSRLLQSHHSNSSKALLTGAGVDAECRAAAMAALEREGSISSSATGAITDGGEGAGGDGAAAVVRQRIHTSGVNFSRFVAAVRAVLLFEGTRCKLY